MYIHPMPPPGPALRAHPGPKNKDIYMGASILYPSRQNSLGYPLNKPRKLFYI